MTTYTPRRMPKRYLDGAPANVLDIFDAGPDTFDRYTVVYGPAFEGRGPADQWHLYRGMSEHPSQPNGFGIMGELTRWELSAYRDRCRRTRIRWADLPADVRAVAVRDCEAFDNEGN